MVASGSPDANRSDGPVQPAASTRVEAARAPTCSRRSRSRGARTDGAGAAGRDGSRDPLAPARTSRSPPPTSWPGRRKAGSGTTRQAVAPTFLARPAKSWVRRQQAGLASKKAASGPPILDRRAPCPTKNRRPGRLPGGTTPAHDYLDGLPAGGCQPASAQRPRAVMIAGRFMRSATTVALPTADTPSTRVPSALHAKCSAHVSVRGLKSVVGSPVSGSSACVASLLNSLHGRHARHTFSNDVLPPFERGSRWSYVSGIPLLSSLVRQYRQRPPSTSSMRARRSSARYVATEVGGLQGDTVRCPRHRRSAAAWAFLSMKRSASSRRRSSSSRSAGTRSPPAFFSSSSS